MRVPTESELAAIAAAYMILARPPAVAPAAMPPWRRAARTAGLADTIDARTAPRGSLWRLAGRRP